MATHIDELKVGDTDRLGRVVAKVFSRESGEYIIYETKDGSVACDGDHEGLDDVVHDCYMKIADLTTEHRGLKRFNSSLAHALKVALDGDPDTASNTLERLYKKMVGCLKRSANQAYLLNPV
jgi:hypothetical protein